jgi:hypothetical protein
MSKNGYRGRSKATLKLFAVCREIIEPIQPITVRGVAYRLFVAGHIESMERPNVQMVGRILGWAREEDLIPWEWIVDESRQVEVSPHWKDLTGYAKAIEKSFRRDFWAHQPYVLTVISEKSTVAGILRPVLDEYGVPFFAAHGFNSKTKMHDFAEMVIGDPRRTVFLYVGDYDPSGMFMSEVDMPRRLAKYGCRVGIYTLKRIALTADDVSNLPSFEAEEKKTDPRYKWYVSHYGEKCWEIDATNPNDLRSRVKSEIERYIKPGDWQRHKKIEAAQRETTKRIATAMAEAGAK